MAQNKFFRLFLGASFCLSNNPAFFLKRNSWIFMSNAPICFPHIFSMKNSKRYKTFSGFRMSSASF
jgi:hypothetical protein